MQSTLVICALGDDDKNLEAALMMRQLFAGFSPQLNCPDIYAVVYDNQKAKNFPAVCSRQNADNSSPECKSREKETYFRQTQIQNYRGELYNISICGSMKSQYSIRNIRLFEDMERESLIYHIDWFWTINETETEKSFWGSVSVQNKAKSLENELNKYIHYEYYRRSSMAKALHKKSLKARGLYTPEKLNKVQGHDPANKACRCEICEARITEHMRWNAFMRVNGYRYGEARNDMAKIHPCLKAWNELPLEERVKD